MTALQLLSHFKEKLDHFKMSVTSYFKDLSSVRAKDHPVGAMLFTWVDSLLSTLMQTLESPLEVHLITI